MASLPCKVAAAIAGSSASFPYDARPASASSNPAQNLVRIAPPWCETVGVVYRRPGSLGSRDRSCNSTSSRASGVGVRAFGGEGVRESESRLANEQDDSRQIRDLLASSTAPDADVSAGMGLGGCDFLETGRGLDCASCGCRRGAEGSGDQESGPCLVGLMTAAQFARNDATLLARGFSSLDSRAREDVALLGSKFLTLDARAREDAGLLDAGARLRARRLRHLALGLEESAREELTRYASQHWSDGALAADLRLADMRMRRRVLEDVFLAREVVKSLHSAIVTLLRPNAPPSLPSSTAVSSYSTKSQSTTSLHPSPSLQRTPLAPSSSSPPSSIPLSGDASLLRPPSQQEQQPIDASTQGDSKDGEEGRSVSTNPLPPRQRHPLSTLSFKTLEALEELYREIGPHSLTPQEGDEEGEGEDEEWGVLGGGADDSSTEELGFLLAALVDMGEVSSSYGLALLHRCCSSPHALLRLTALDALSSAPSLAALGNAGSAVLQKLTTDADPQVAAAATGAIAHLQEKWQVQQQGEQGGLGGKQDDLEGTAAGSSALSLEQAFSLAAAKWQLDGQGDSSVDVSGPDGKEDV